MARLPRDLEEILKAMISTLENEMGVPENYLSGEVATIFRRGLRIAYDMGNEAAHTSTTITPPPGTFESIDPSVGRVKKGTSYVKLACPRCDTLTESTSSFYECDACEFCWVPDSKTD